MEKEILKINLLAIAGSGVLMLLSGGFLYIFKEQVSSSVRFLLPIPPLGVAAYVFVFNMFKHYNGDLSGKPLALAREVLYSTAISAIVFGFFTVLLVIGIHYLKKYL